MVAKGAQTVTEKSQAPKAWQNKHFELVKGTRSGGVSVFIDDIIVFTPGDESEHMVRVMAVLEQLQKSVMVMMLFFP